MNKKISIFILMLLFVWVLEAEDLKFYSFKDEGYSGYAIASYMAYMPPLDVVEKLAESNEEYYKKQSEEYIDKQIKYCCYFKYFSF